MRQRIRGGSWWFLVGPGGSWWFVVVRGGSWWSLVVRGGSPVSQAHGHHHTVQCFALLHCSANQFCTTPGGRRGGHEATETGFAYAPVSQAHGHNHDCSMSCLLHCSVDKLCTTPGGF